MAFHSGVGIVGQPLLGPWVDAAGRRPFMLYAATRGLLTALLLAGAALSRRPAEDTRRQPPRAAK
ncbi:MAG: hypothetical protein ACREM3_15035 [Candidatus Rokuibacteriota bacterium]